MGDHVRHTPNGQKGPKIMYVKINMMLHKFRFKEHTRGLIFVPDMDVIVTIGDEQGTFKHTLFAFLSSSNEIFCSQRFIESSIDARQIGLSNYVVGQCLLSKVQCTTQLLSVPSDGHGVVLKPFRSEEYDSPLSGLKKHFVRQRHEMPS